MKIKKGNQVLIISGKDKGKKGKVLLVFPKKEKILIEGVNIRKKHAKPKKEGEKGEIVEIAASIHISNVKLICPRCEKAIKIGYKIIEIKGKRQKIKICKSCGGEIKV